MHGGFAAVAGKVLRPAIYELRPGETLRDAIAFAGGFDPSAVDARVTIHRILPPESRGAGGRARVVIAGGADKVSGGVAPPVPLAPRAAAASDHSRMVAQLKREVGRLIVQTTAAITGKVLTTEDQQRLAEETARQLRTQQ